MKRIVAVLLCLLLFAAGCGGTPATVEPGDGPAASSEPSEASEAPVEEAPTEEAPSEAPSEDAPAEGDEGDEGMGPAVASFDQKYTYDDGVEVEVIEVKARKTGDYALADSGELKKGTPYTYLRVRVRNGSSTRLEAFGSATMTYGPDGEEADMVSAGDIETGVDGTILPGRAKTGEFAYLVPAKHLGDVVLEFTPDFEHEPAIFAGSLK